MVSRKTNIYLGYCKQGFLIFLFNDQGLIVDQILITETNLSDQLVESVDFLLTRNKTNVNNLVGIYINSGPRSLNGIRLSVLFTKTVSGELNIPVYSCSMLKIIWALNSKEEYLLIPNGKDRWYLVSNKDNQYTEKIISQQDKQQYYPNVNVYSFPSCEKITNNWLKLLVCFEPVDNNQLEANYLNDYWSVWK